MKIQARQSGSRPPFWGLCESWGVLSATSQTESACSSVLMLRDAPAVWASFSPDFGHCLRQVPCTSLFLTCQPVPASSLCQVCCCRVPSTPVGSQNLWTGDFLTLTAQVLLPRHACLLLPSWLSRRTACLCGDGHRTSLLSELHVPSGSATKNTRPLPGPPSRLGLAGRQGRGPQGEWCLNPSSPHSPRSSFPHFLWRIFIWLGDEKI